MFVTVPHQKNDTPVDNVQKLLCYKDYWYTVGLHCPSQSAFEISLRPTRRGLLIQCENKVDEVGKLAAMLSLYSLSTLGV